METALIFMSVMALFALAAVGVAIWAFVAQKLHAEEDVHRPLAAVQSLWTAKVVRPSGQELPGAVVGGASTYQFFRLGTDLNWVQFHLVLPIVNSNDAHTSEPLIVELPAWAAPLVQISGTVDAKAAGVVRLQASFAGSTASTARQSTWATLYPGSSTVLPKVSGPSVRLEGLSSDATKLSNPSRAELTGHTLVMSGSWLCTGVPELVSIDA
jgi:hypothetical protein